MLVCPPDRYILELPVLVDESQKIVSSCQSFRYTSASGAPVRLAVIIPDVTAQRRIQENHARSRYYRMIQT